MPARGDMEELVPLPTGDAGAAEWYLFWLSQLLLYGLGLFWSIPAAPAPVSLRGTDGLVTRQWRRSCLVHDIARRQLDCLSRPDHRDGCMAFGDNNLV